MISILAAVVLALAPGPAAAGPVEISAAPSLPSAPLPIPPALALPPVSPAPISLVAAGPAAALVPAAAAAPVAWTQRLLRPLEKAKAWLRPPMVEPGYNDNLPGFYHGTSFATLLAIARSGGNMTEGKTYLSDEAGYPRGYARSNARRTGTPGFILQFPPQAIEGKTVPGHYHPTQQEPFQILAYFHQAVKPIPLSDQTEGSKATILNWIRSQRDANPGDSSWTEKLALFERAFRAP